MRVYYFRIDARHVVLATVNLDAGRKADGDGIDDEAGLHDA